MDRFEEFSREYRDLEKKVRLYLKDAPEEFGYYIQSLLLRIWAGNGRYSEDYAKAIQIVSGKLRSGEEILKAMMDTLGASNRNKVPVFFAAMVEEDFDKGSKRTADFVEGLKSLMVGGACINGDFTVEESAAVSQELKKLMTYAISKGVKIDYATGRIRKKTTPLKMESYERSGSEDRDMGKLFDALSDSFLMPAELKRRELQERKDPDAAQTDPWTADGKSGETGPGAAGAEDSGQGEDKEGSADAGQEAKASLAEENLAKEDPRTMEELMEELDGLVGLDSIKKDIHSLMNFIQITRLREERGLSVPAISYHLVFTGNPGTGKTTVARLVAGLYHRIGILPKGQLVEVDRSQLVAGYTGQTAIKTREVIEQAMGGVLFIDEAYALVNDDQDSFGKEAVETILKSMEDHRDELVVIVAGYTELMHKFIESNPGFKSRFSKFFEFPDYTGKELLQIFVRFCDSNGYKLSDDARALMEKKLEEMYQSRSRHFGNGRTVRNIFEKAIHEQANRLTKEKEKGEVSDSQLQQLSVEDVVAAVEAEQGKFTASDEQTHENRG